MSDNWLQLIPHDPEFQPSIVSAEAARRLLASFVPDADEINATFKPTKEFFHPGGNWSGVRCPVCKADIEEWWNDAMSEASKTGFADLSATTPCCSAATSLNELDYLSPAGFGRFVLEALNPNVESLTPSQDHGLAALLGRPLRKIWMHI